MRMAPPRHTQYLNLMHVLLQLSTTFLSSWNSNNAGSVHALSNSLSTKTPGRRSQYQNLHHQTRQYGLTTHKEIASFRSFLSGPLSSSSLYSSSIKGVDTDFKQSDNKNNKNDDDDEDDAADDDFSKLNEWERLKVGYNDVISGRAIDLSAWKKLATIEDIIGIFALVPLSIESAYTAISGTVDTNHYLVCAVTTFICGLAHWKMSYDIPRDYRAPRLAEYKTVYEFSALYLLAFSWFLWRITPAFPTSLESFDILGCIFLSMITIYGFVDGFFSKKELEEANQPGYVGKLEPSDEAYRAQAQLYLTGNIVINVLACLFVPFAWTLAIRGTGWWERVQHLHACELGFLGVSVLVAIVGDIAGTLLLRLKQQGLLTSEPGIVVIGIISNIVLLLFPEIIFNTIYNSQVSEVGFYWE